MSQPATSLIAWPAGTMWGFASHITFVCVGVLEIVFLTSTAIVAGSVPGAETSFLFSQTIGFVVLACVLAHIAGLLFALIGLRVDRDTTQAWVGLGLNAIVPIAFAIL